MSSTTVYDAFKARLTNQFGGTYAVRDFEEIEVSLQQGVAPWIALEGSSGTDELTSIGNPQSNWVNDDGFMDIHVFTPSNGGLSPCRTIADQIREAFRYYHFTGLAAGETLRVDETNPPDPGALNDGLWNSMIVTIGYTHRYARPTAA